MKRKFSLATLLVLFVCVPAFLALTGCGGGGGSSSSSTSGTTGTVAVLLTDGPADDYANIWIWITEISLLPEDDNAAPVVVFESDDPDGWKVDLLDLRDEDAVVTVKDGIPAGRYSKIRLRIADIQPEGGDSPCDQMEIKLPSGKIDLNPKGGFAVIPGETISIRLDIDCDKSINLHQAGNSGKCIFRPVVFVEIDKIEAPRKCPRILKGVIDEVFDGDSGFTLLLGEGREPLTVYLADGVFIFGEDGMEALAEDLEKGQTVHVRGRLDQDGNLQASVIVIGGVVLVKGTVNESFDGDMFPLELMPPHFFTSNIAKVAVSDDTFVMTGCDQEVEPEAIQAGMLARVVGKVSSEDGSIQAIAVLLKKQRIVGKLIAALGPDNNGGYELTVQVSETETIDIFMPSNVEPEMGNIGPLSIEVIQGLLDCQTLGVSIATEFQEGVLTATDVQVYPSKAEGIVKVEPVVEDQFGQTVVTLILDVGEGKTISVLVPETAIVKDDRCPPVYVDPANVDIKKDDTLLVLGFKNCGGVNLYDAYMVIIRAPAEPQQQ